MSLLCLFFGCKPLTTYYGGHEDRPCFHCARCGRQMGLWTTLVPWPDPPIPIRPQPLAVPRWGRKRLTRAKVKR
jgi:hypothetical protein